jgi:hypothetical protein
MRKAAELPSPSHQVDATPTASSAARSAFGRGDEEPMQRRSSAGVETLAVAYESAEPLVKFDAKLINARGNAPRQHDPVTDCEQTGLEAGHRAIAAMDFGHAGKRRATGR